MRAASGTNSRKSPAALPPSSAVMKLDPVTLPPGRLRLATRPTLTGSPPVAKTIGIVVVAPWPRVPNGVSADDHGHLPANQVGRQRRQTVGLILRPAIFDRDVLALDIACFLQALAECESRRVGDRQRCQPCRNPITGIAGCCARAASGHAAAAPPSSVMNSRRLAAWMPPVGFVRRNQDSTPRAQV